MDADQRARRDFGRQRGNVSFGNGYFSGGAGIGSPRPKRRVGRR
jgi:hypothetical protein